MQIKHISAPKKAMRPRVREMEAFGWVLDDHEDEERGKVKMRFLRPEMFSETAELRKLELAFSRLPKEWSLINLRFGTAIVISILLGLAFGGGLKSPFYGVVIFVLTLSLLMGFLSAESRKLSRKKEMILDNALRKTKSAREISSSKLAAFDPGDAPR